MLRRICQQIDSYLYISSPSLRLSTPHLFSNIINTVSSIAWIPQTRDRDDSGTVKLYIFAVLLLSQSDCAQLFAGTLGIATARCSVILGCSLIDLTISSPNPIEFVSARFKRLRNPRPVDLKRIS